MTIIWTVITHLWSFKGQLTEVTKVLEDNHIHSVLILAVFTEELQPMDISINKVIKSFMCKKFWKWHAQQVTELYLNSDDELVDLSFAQIKHLSAHWMKEVVEH